MSANTQGADPFARAAAIVAHDADLVGDAVVPPIVQSSLFTFASVAEMMATFAGKTTRPIYSRGLNPTVRAFEEKVAALECAEDALAFSSGMAAISSTLLAFVAPGERIVSVTHVYPDAFRFFETVLKRLGVIVDYADPADHGALAEKLIDAKLLYLESPNSWMMEAHALSPLAALAKEHGVISVVDNSAATPVFQQPHRLGCDLVVHSASKYLSGHSDTVAGIVAGSGEHIGRLRAEVLPFLGGKLSAFEAWLLLRGLRTLPQRMADHQGTARTLAQRLSEQPCVTAVHHPALAAALPEGLTGTSGLFSIEVSEAVDIVSFCEGLRLFKLGVSWGGHESLVVPALVTHAQAGEPNPARVFDVPERMVRVSAGLEGVELLWADLARSLQQATRRTHHDPEDDPHRHGAGGSADGHRIGTDARAR